MKIKSKCIQSVVLSTICFLVTVPDGINNYQIHGIYTLSGIGVKTFFHNGNSQENYDFVFKNIGLNDGQEMHYIFDTTYYFKGLGKINAMPHQKKQDLHLDLAVKWINENPIQFLQLKLYSGIRFFAPGVSFSKYNIKIWFFSILSSAPIFIMAYISLFWIIKNGDLFHHRFIFFLMANIFIFYIVFMPQTRFRAITLEPFYIIYASNTLLSIIKRLSNYNQFAKTVLK